MTAWQIALTVILCCAAAAALTAAAYFFLLPAYLVRKLRGGKDNISFPPDFAEKEALVKKTADLTYVSRYPSNTYDLYMPASATKPVPVIVWLHGGFFVAGDKNGVRNVATCLAAKGFAVCALNYALAPEYKYPSALIQLDEFIMQVKDIPGVDPHKVVIAGDSAGGGIAIQYAALISNGAMRKALDFAPAADPDDIAALLAVCAPVDVAMLRGLNKTLDKLLPIFGRAYYGKGKWWKGERFSASKTLDFITPEFPPAFLTDGNHVSFGSQNAALGKELAKNGVRVEELYFPAEEGNVEHEYLFRLDEPRAQAALEDIALFLHEVVLKRKD